MAENIELSGRQTANVEQAIRDLARVQGVPVSEVKLTENSLKELAKSIADGTFKAMEKTNKVLETNVGKLLTRATKEQKEMNESLKGKFSSLKWWTGQDKSESGLTAIRRAENITGGIEAMFNGNFMSGLKQFGTAIPQIANFMGGPLFSSISLAIKGFIKLDEHLTKLNKTMITSSGGAYSPFLNASYAEKYQRKTDLANILASYNRSGEVDEILGYIGGNYANRFIVNNRSSAQLANITGFSRTQFEGIGLDKNFSDNFIKNIIRSTGLDMTQKGSSDILKTQIDRLIQKTTVGAKGIFSSPELIKQGEDLYNQVKKFGLNIDWSVGVIDRFSKEINKGTIAMSDFASINRGAREGQTGKLAGVGQMLIQSGLRSGLEIPEEMLQNQDNQLALAWTMRQLASRGDKRLMNLMGNWAQQTIPGVSGDSKAAQMEMLYSFMGPEFMFSKLSQPQVEKMVQSGYADFAGAYGISGGQLPNTSTKELKDVNERLQTLIDQNTTEVTKMTEAISTSFRNVWNETIHGDLVTILLTNPYTLPFAAKYANHKAEMKRQTLISDTDS